MRVTRRALTCLLLLFAAASTAGAQTFTGGVRGVVSDANGVIPGVTVTLTNEATSVSRDTVTNDVGQYNFPAVQPGTYSIKTQLTGYRTVERTGIRVSTQQFLTLDLQLELGTLQETITVTGESPLIDTTTASTGGTLDREQLETLPAPGRNAFLIGVTVPTVNPVGDPQFNRQQDQTNASRVSLGGGGIRANNYLLEGVPITELRGRAIANPTIEALEEVKVQVHTYDAEMGRTGGGVFNVTAKSGTNQYRGSGFFQTRPVWGQNLNFFDERAGETKESSGVADSYYRLYGGGIGGPIFRNRTFFWAATEGYRSLTTRGLQFVWPTARQRAGDFSQTTVDGSPVRLFNPWCRGLTAPSARCPATGTGSLATGGEFTNAIIPRTHPAANTVGFNLLNSWPTETISGEAVGDNEDGNPTVGDTARLVDEADMLTLKVDHKLTDNWTLSGFYLYNNTDEPGSGIMPDDFKYIENQGEFFTTLRRRPHVLAINSTNVLNDSTVLALRYGWLTWQDQTDTAVYDPGLASLGFSNNYVNAINEEGRTMFPELLFDDITDVGGWGGDKTRWTGRYAINATLTKLMGSHSIKAGADMRELGLEITTELSNDSGGRFLGGSFEFNRNFTSNLAGVGGHEFASLLLGLPVNGKVPFNSGEGEWFTRYYGAYIQDDWRVNSKFTLNYGVRLEHEDGLREVENRQVVAFDENAVSPLDAIVPKTGALAGRTIRGGLIFAGVDGANEYQGDPPALKVAPRVGATYAMNTDTVIRGGYGTFYAPWQYAQAQHGQIGFARQTTLIQSASESAIPITTLDNPFPGGLQQPIGSSLGLLTGVGGNVNYIDQNKGAPIVHQYSVDLQRELPGEMAVTFGYMGATGRDLGFAGTENVGININQIDPELARQLFPAANGGWDPARLREQVPNPFFGIAQAGELGTTETIARGQLLRPFPQFGDVNVFERTEGGKRQYHAVTAVIEKRLARSWWGGRYSYTWSRLEDNQFGESSAYQTRTAVPQNVYDLDAEYGISNFDSPHRIVLAPLFRFGSSTGPRAWLTGGWSAAAIVELVSGSPLNAVMSSGASDTNLGLFGGRQRPNLVGDPNTSGSDNDRVSTDDNPGGRWFDANAFQNPGAGQFGNAPRTIGDARYQFRKNVDVSVAKDFRLAGSSTAQVKFEILNLTNTAKFNGSSADNAINNTGFGRITSQRGFMRIWQISMRLVF
jgi:trimeric autotransporter adhesin